MAPNIIYITDPPYNAVCDNFTDNGAALVAAIAALPNGGKIIVPGPTRTSQTLYITKGITVEGIGMGASGLYAIGDIGVLHFTAGSDNGGFRDIGLYGKQDASATKNVVEVEENACIHMKDSRVWGGYSALFDKGSDGIRENVFFSGANPGGACVASNGQNWWVRCKLDKSAWPQTWGFLQGISPAWVPSSENTFTDCDFSGDFTYSMQVDDGGSHKANVVLNGCVLSSPVLIGNALWAAFNTCRFGSNITAGMGVPITVANSFGLAPLTVTGGVKHLSNNHNIT